MYIEILILGLLHRKPMHGYEIKLSVEKITGVNSVTNSQLYPTLARFIEAGFISKEVVPQEKKPDRHLYSITAHGECGLREMLIDVTPALLFRDREFYARVACFSLLSSEERVAILAMRKNGLLQRKERVASWSAKGWVAKTARLRDLLLSTELATIEDWIQEETSYDKGEIGGKHA
jgi:DNA-binding PadR family transcriptional regulator